MGSAKRGREKKTTRLVERGAMGQAKAVHKSQTNVINGGIESRGGEKKKAFKSRRKGEGESAGVAALRVPKRPHLVIGTRKSEPRRQNGEQKALESPPVRMTKRANRARKKAQNRWRKLSSNSFSSRNLPILAK